MVAKNPTRPTRTEAQKKHAREADKSAELLVEKLKPMHRTAAEQYVRQNLPSDPAPLIVGLAFYRQRKAARNPRPNALQVLIDEIVANYLKKSSAEKITPATLLVALRDHVGGGVIDAINETEGIIEWRDKKHPAGISHISGLKDRLNRAKKKPLSR